MLTQLTRLNLNAWKNMENVTENTNIFHSFPFEPRRYKKTNIQYKNKYT